MTSMVFRPQRRRRRAQVNLTSLIDVLFLLLIFFMLTSTFRMRGELDLTLPQSSTSTPVSSQNDPLTEITLRADGSVEVNGSAVAADQLRARLLALSPEPASSRVSLAAEAEARHADVVRLLDLVREVGYGGSALEPKCVDSKETRREDT